MGKQNAIRWHVTGDSIQAATVTLPPGEGVVGEAGAMLFAGDGIDLSTGLTTRTDDPSIVSSIAEAIRRKVAGDTFFVTRFTNSGKVPSEVAFSAPYPGTIVRLDLDGLPEGIILQKDAFLCGSRDIEITVAFQRNVLAGIFGGEGFILQRIRSGSKGAVVLAHAGGSLLERTLGAGESLRIDAGCVVAYEPSVEFDVRVVNNDADAALRRQGRVLRHADRPRARVDADHAVHAPRIAHLGGRAAAPGAREGPEGRRRGGRDAPGQARGPGLSGLGAARPFTSGRAGSRPRSA